MSKRLGLILLLSIGFSTLPLNASSLEESFGDLEIKDTTSDYQIVMKKVKDYTVFDFETTGLNILKDEVIQIGAIRYRNDVEVNRFCTYVKPKGRISPLITSITGITSTDVKAAPSAKCAFENFIKFIGNDVLIAHNANFDMRFLIKQMERFQLESKSFCVIDTLNLAKKAISGTLNYKLETLKKYLGIDVVSHHALFDCIVCAKLYQKCKESSIFLSNEDYLSSISDVLQENKRDHTRLRVTAHEGSLIFSSGKTFLNLKIETNQPYILCRKNIEELKKKYPKLKYIKNDEQSTKITFKHPFTAKYFERLILDEFDAKTKKNVLHTSKVSSNNQITIIKYIRKLLDINPGDYLEFQIDPSQKLIIKKMDLGMSDAKVFSSRMKKNNQVTVPKIIRDQTDIIPGTIVQFVHESNGITIHILKEDENLK